MYYSELEVTAEQDCLKDEEDENGYVEQAAKVT
jgi:hypothetical protein